MREPGQEYYSTRCRISHRPPFRTAEPIFYRCPVCGALTVINPMPKGGQEPILYCCGKQLYPLELCRDEEVLSEHKIDYVVFGGFERSGVRITVDGGSHPMWEDHKIEWVYLHTFQGGQLKFLPSKTRAVIHFSLADEDAYVYCDREVCRMGREHCQFECKRGMVAYAYCNVHGLVRLILQGKKSS